MPVYAPPKPTGMQTRDLVPRPSSADAEARTIDVVLTTGARGVRYSWEGRFEEELIVSAEAVDLDRLNNFAPFLSDHEDRRDIGVFVPGSAKIDNGQVIARVQFYPEDELDENDARIVKRILNGHRRNLSIGYDVTEWNYIPAADRSDSDMGLYQAARWVILEGSSVSIPFEAITAGTRSAQGGPTQQPPTKEDSMSDKATEPERDKTPATPPDHQPEPKPDVKEIERHAAERAAEAESARVARIMETGDKLGIDQPEVRAMIKDRTPADQAVARMIDMHAEAKAAQAPGTGSFSIAEDEKEKRAACVVNALAHRMSAGRVELSEAGRVYRSDSLLDIGRELYAPGRKMEKHTLIRQMISPYARAGHSVDDFPLMMADAMNKSLLVLFEAEPKTYQAWMRKGNANDFRAKYVAKIGGSATWKETPEGMPYEPSTVSEEGENYAIKTYSSAIDVTRQMLINDDLDGVMRMVEQTIAGASAVQQDLAYSLLDSNPALSDTEDLFSAAHANYSAAAAAPSLTTLGACYSAMGSQTDINGGKLSLEPAVMLVPMTGSGAYRQKAEQLIYGQINPTQSTNVVPQYMRGLTIVADSRVDEAKWYAFASPMRAPVFEYAFLSGQEQPTVELRQMDAIQGLSYGCFIDFGVGAIDYRGAYMNAA